MAGTLTKHCILSNMESSGEAINDPRACAKGESQKGDPITSREALLNPSPHLVVFMHANIHRELSES